MKYEFPVITNIDQVKSAIKDKPEFIIAERDDYDVVNYLVGEKDTFEGPDAPLLRECRGLIFDKQGVVIARRLHKFFNVNEKPETQIENINLSEPHVILEKLDGSMITPIPIGDAIRWGTKMGVTDISMQAEEFVARHPSYGEFAKKCIENENKYTPIFEWCSNKQRIVIDQPEDRLVLIAMRINKTGVYFNYEQLQRSAYIFGLDVVKQYPGTCAGMEELVSTTRDMEGLEGFVVRFDTGHMVKIKSDWYVRIHKAKGALQSEKNVVSLIVNQEIDDVKSFLLKEDKEKLEAVELLFTEGLDLQAKMFYNHILLEHSYCKGSKKTFALERKGLYSQIEHPIIFKLWKEDVQLAEVREFMIEMIKKKCGTQTNIDQVRSLWGGHNMEIWNA
jgi:RNA ligase